MCHGRQHLGGDQLTTLELIFSALFYVGLCMKLRSSGSWDELLYCWHHLSRQFGVLVSIRN